MAKKPRKSRPDNVPPKVILLVEDNPSLLALTKNLLEAEGYTVLTAKDGEVALGLLVHGPTTIDLLLCDVVLPRIPGTDLARFTSAQRPMTKVVLYSGQVDNLPAQLGDIADRIAILSKPFEIETLRATMRQALESPSNV
jgi:two-component system, cell cycle sensor histidine kinase and response regulator CckA